MLLLPSAQYTKLCLLGVIFWEDEAQFFSKICSRGKIFVWSNIEISTNVIMNAQFWIVQFKKFDVKKEEEKKKNNKSSISDAFQNTTFKAK